MAESITTTSANENVLSPDGETLYVIGTDGKVRAYSVDTKALLFTYTVGVNLGGADVTPDGRYLVVAEREPVSSMLDQYGTRSYVIGAYRLDLQTGEAQRYDFSPSYYLDYTFYDVAVLSNGKVLLSQSFSGSGWINLKTLDLTTGTYTTLPMSVRQDSVMSLTDDRTKVLIAEANISNAEIDLYQVGPTGSLTFLKTNGSSGFNRGVQDISGDGRYVANYVFGAGLLIFDAELKFVRNLANEFPSWQSGSIDGLAFDANGANLFVFDASSKSVVQVSTATWTEVRRFPLDPSEIGVSPNGKFGNNLTVTDDGDYLIVHTSTGIQRLSIGFKGTASADTLVGTTGPDFFRLEQGGDDKANGNAGDDAFYFGSALTASDNANGEAGNDQLALQGNYKLTLGANNLVNIETLALLSSQDDRFGGGNPSALFSYDLTFVDANIAAGQVFTVNYGQLRAGENVRLDLSVESDGRVLVYAGNGDDTLIGGASSDGFFFGENGRFSAADRIDGRAGTDDQVGLRGTYSLVFNADTITNVETLAFLSGKDTRFGALGPDYNYNVTTHDANVSAGQRLTVNAASLRSTETVVFNGSAETNGTFRVFSGQGNDTITGGAQADFIYGGLGKDQLTGGTGGDTFFYRTAADSTSNGFDVLVGFDAREDRIDLPGVVSGFGGFGGFDGFGAFPGGPKAGVLNSASFDSDLKAALDPILAPGQFALFTPTGGDMANRTFAVVDGNGQAGYQSGEDFVFEFVALAVPLPSSTEFFI